LNLEQLSVEKKLATSIKTNVRKQNKNKTTFEIVSFSYLGVRVTEFLRIKYDNDSIKENSMNSDLISLIFEVFFNSNKKAKTLKILLISVVIIITFFIISTKNLFGLPLFPTKSVLLYLLPILNPSIDSLFPLGKRVTFLFFSLIIDLISFLNL
jgi:hypothetical protein